MIEIEFIEPQYFKCECCGGSSANLTRFVYEDGNAIAIYKATFAENHQEIGVMIAIGLDDNWESEFASVNRVAFACRIWENESEFVVSVTDRNESPWINSKVLGRMLDRDEALSHGSIDQVFHITDHILSSDLVIKSFLDGESIH